MRRRIDPDAMYYALALRWGYAEANTVCPEVEPERPKYDYRADWTRHPDPSGNNDVTWYCKYCDGWTDHPPKARHACPERPAEPGSDRCGCAMFGYIHARKECDAYRDKPAEPVKPAPAADPRRLTEEEVVAAYRSMIGKTGLLSTCLHAVAAAQLKKARVTISSEDINAWYCSMRGGLPALTALLRRHGVEVTP